VKIVWTRCATTASAMVLLLLAATISPALATDRRFPGTTPFPTAEPFRFPGTTPLPGIPPARVTPPTPPQGHSAHDGHHRRRPIVIVQPPPVYYYTPRPAGSWSYRWIPRYVEIPVWMPGHWAPDGQWVAGHYEARWSDYGAWEPYWVPAY